MDADDCEYWGVGGGDLGHNDYLGQDNDDLGEDSNDLGEDDDNENFDPPAGEAPKHDAERYLSGARRPLGSMGLLLGQILA